MWESWIYTGTFFSFISSPAEQDPERGLRSPRSDRVGSASDRSGHGAVRRVTAERWHPQLRRQTRLRGCRSVEQDGAWSRAVGLPVDGARARRSALACGTRAPTTGGAMRSADLWAARRSERPWREPPAYADRIGRSAFDSSYSRNRDRRITALSRACTCESGGNGAGTSAIDSKGESAGAGISGSTGSLGRARTFRRSG